MSDRTVIPSARQVEAPAGYYELDLHDPYEAYLGPLFAAEDGAMRFAFYVDERHVDTGGRCHEGMLMTFSDAFSGTAAHRGSDGKTCVTVSMQTNYMAFPKLGDLVTVVPKVDHKTRSILFVSAEFFVDEEQVMSSSSLWKVIGAR